MGLRCSNCGSTNTIMTTREKLEKAHQSVPTTTPALGTAGFLSPGAKEFIIIEIIKKLIDILFKEEEEYLVCKDCGYYKKID